MPEKKIFGSDAARALAEIAKDPALQSPRTKEIFSRLYSRFEGRGASLQECYLLESELSAARAGRLAANPDIPPFSDGSSGGSGGSNNRGPSHPEGGGGGGAREDAPGGHYSELQGVGDEVQWFSADFREFLSGGSTRRGGTMQNSLGGSGPRGGGAAVMDRPARVIPRVAETSSGPRVGAGDVGRPPTRQASPAGNAHASAQGRVASAETPTAPPGAAVESVQLVRPLVEMSPSLAPEGLGVTPIELERAGWLATSPLARPDLLAHPRLRIEPDSTRFLQPDTEPEPPPVGLLLENAPRFTRRTELLPSVDIPEIAAPQTRLSRPSSSVPGIAASQITIPSEAVASSASNLAIPDRADTSIARSPARAGVELLQEVPVPAPFTVGAPTPLEFSRISPSPEILPVAPFVAHGIEPMPRPELHEEPQPLGVPLPRRQLGYQLSMDLHPHQTPQPHPELQLTQPRVAQVTEEQSKRRRELEFGPGSDTKHREDRRIQEEQRVLLAAKEELKKKKSQRRLGRRVARRVVAGEIGSFTVEEDQQTQYDKDQFTSSRMRINEGREDS